MSDIELQQPERAVHEAEDQINDFVVDVFKVILPKKQCVHK